ncbi:MAG: hypothetical protein MJZ75_07220 [Paludibacteraceae bacterium]|nr:hypothetical protein [Paludibacteraceae bacterium]
MACHPAQEDVSPVVRRQVIVLSSPNGIGDHGYNDVIMTGLERAYLKCENMKMLFFDPTSIEKAEALVDYWTQDGASNVERTMVVLAASDYYDLVKKKLSDPNYNPKGVEMLVFEVPELPESQNTVKAYSFLITMYGASYQAGLYAAEQGKKNPLVWLSNGVDPLLDEARQGFSDGFFLQTGMRPDTACLSVDWHGYSMSEEAYRQMPDKCSKYDFLFPVMGGSNMGIFRYLREHPEGPDVAGMDVDQSLFSANVVGNVLKHIDQVVEKYIVDWSNDLPPEHYNLYDSQSGYIEWSVVARQ